jgi:hypothetical protein
MSIIEPTKKLKLNLEIDELLNDKKIKKQFNLYSFNLTTELVFFKIKFQDFLKLEKNKNVEDKNNGGINDDINYNTLFNNLPDFDDSHVLKIVDVDNFMKDNINLI